MTLLFKCMLFDWFRGKMLIAYQKLKLKFSTLSFKIDFMFKIYKAFFLVDLLLEWTEVHDLILAKEVRLS